MADPKTKPAANGVTAKNGINGVNGVNGAAGGRPFSKTTKLYETIRNMVSSANAVTSELGGLPDLEKLMENEKRLRKEVEDKANEVAQLKTDKDKEVADKNKEMETLKKDIEEQIRLVREEKDKEIDQLKTDLEAAKEAKRVLMESFEQRVEVHSQAKAEKVAATEKLAETQQHLEAKEGEAVAAQQRVSELEQSSTRAAAEVKTLTAEKDKIVREKTLLFADLQASQAELQISESDLDQLRKDIGEDLLTDYSERDLNKFRNDLEAFAEVSRGLVTEFFRDGDTALNAVHLPHSLEHLKRVPLPKSGSSPDLRCLVAQAVIAKFLRSHIFQPFFLPPDLEASGQQVFDYLSEDVQRATIFRCQILAACDRNDSGKAVAAHAVDEVYRQLCAFVPATKYISLQQRLAKLFAAGVALWAHLQRSKLLVFSDDLEDENIDEVDECQKPKLWEEYGTQATAATGGPGEVIATLFPQVVMEVNDDILHVIHPGVGLWSDQAVVVAALDALAKGQSNGRGNGEVRPSTGRRRSSSSAPSGRG